jgi:hypothetical protein
MYWNDDELAGIAKAGFSALNADPDQRLVDRFVRESAGSPQLMQLLCLNTCFVLNLRDEHDGMFPTVLNVTDEDVYRILEQTSANTDFRSLVDVLDAGPRTRGTERKKYEFSDGRTGDVYTVVLRALALDPPKLSFTYNELLERTAAACIGESPVGSSVMKANRSLMCQTRTSCSIFDGLAGWGGLSARLLPEVWPKRFPLAK